MLRSVGGSGWKCAYLWLEGDPFWRGVLGVLAARLYECVFSSSIPTKWLLTFPSAQCLRRTCQRLNCDMHSFGRRLLVSSLGQCREDAPVWRDAPFLLLSPPPPFLPLSSSSSFQSVFTSFEMPDPSVGRSLRFWPSLCRRNADKWKFISTSVDRWIKGTKREADRGALADQK